MFKSFANYLEARKEDNENFVGEKDQETGLSGKTKTQIVADYEGPAETCPPKNNGAQGTVAPYKSATGNLDPNKNIDKTGLGTIGDKKLIYNIDGQESNGKNIATWPKTKTEAFVEQTKEMSGAQFMKFMLEENCPYCGEDAEGLPTVSSKSGPFHPHPTEAVRYVVALGKKSPKIIENLIHDAKRSGILKDIIKSSLDHPESYEHFSDLLGEEDGGEDRARHLARVMFANEHVSHPQGIEDEDHDDDDEKNDMHNSDDETDFKDDSESDGPDDQEGEGDNDNDDEQEDDDSNDGSEEENQDEPMPKKKSAQNLFNAMRSYMKK